MPRAGVSHSDGFVGRKTEDIRYHREFLNSLNAKTPTETAGDFWLEWERQDKQQREQAEKMRLLDAAVRRLRDQRQRQEKLIVLGLSAAGASEKEIELVLALVRQRHPNGDIGSSEEHAATFVKVKEVRQERR